MRNLRYVLTGIVLLLMAAGCSFSGDTWPEYRNDTFPFSVKYPPNWEINKGKLVPPPPYGTSFQGDGAAISITVWMDPTDGREAPGLSSDGWSFSEVKVGGEKASYVARPSADSKPGIWRQVYATHDGKGYEIGLLVHDPSRSVEAIRAFDRLLQSFRWVK